MTFGFQLLVLLLMFLLLMVYYTKKDSFTKGNKIYRSILLVTYILQLVSLGVYIILENGINSSIFFKLYFSLILVWFSLFGFYYISNYLRVKYFNDKKVLIDKHKGIGLLYASCSSILILIALFLPVNLVNGYFDYSNHIISYFIEFYLIIEFLMLFINYKGYKKDILINLIIMFIIQGGMFFLQTRSPEIPFINIGMILVVYYCYFMLENSDKQELYNITLERDYAKKQSIDKSDFLKVLSHEIRTPLNTIDGFSQIIMDSDNLDEIKNDILDIRLASRDLIDVINGMIDLSILESGNLEVLAENYNVYDMFDDIKNITESKLRDSVVEFKMDVDNDIPEILLGDSERLSQVVMNLVTNAIKYTEKGNITLSVQSVKSNTKCRLKVIVSDTGVGIKREDLANIFEGRSQKKGASLGLAVSKYLIELMGGSIEVESTYGAGSKFILTLDQNIVSDLREEKVTRKRELKAFDAKGKRILVVDDNSLNLKLNNKLLAPYNVSVVEALSGEECLAILDKDTNFDLILMDDLMPNMSGRECLKILKKIQRVSGYYIPVVVLTANAVSGMKEKYLLDGFEDYLAKPIDKYELDRILKKYLKGKK